MRYLLIFLFYSLSFGDTSFITPMEYASQLYKNPRGIGCHLCHGEKGEGKLVATYVHKKKKKTFEGPVINNLDFNAFYEALNERKIAMPRYFLTKKEVQALYLYLQETKDKSDAK